MILNNRAVFCGKYPKMCLIEHTLSFLVSTTVLHRSWPYQADGTRIDHFSDKMLPNKSTSYTNIPSGDCNAFSAVHNAQTLRMDAFNKN